MAPSARRKWFAVNPASEEAGNDDRDIGIGPGQVWIFLVGLDHDGRIVLQRRIRRARLLTVTANLPKCAVGMDASCGAHFLGHAATQGHDARLPPQYVKPYVKTNKNDYRDAEANAEACGRPCASCHSKAKNSSIFKRCTDGASG